MKIVVFCLTLAVVMGVEASPATRSKGFLEDSASWVRGCQEGRIYLKGDRLAIENDIMYVINDDNEREPLSELFCDSQGVYIKAASHESARDSGVYNIVWCNNCHAYTYRDLWGMCKGCGKSSNR